MNKRIIMKVNIFLSILALFISAFFGSFVYVIAKQPDYDVLCGICSGIVSFTTLIPFMGFRYESVRLGINIRLFCILFLLIFLSLNLYYAYTGVVMPYYTTFNGILLIIYLGIVYKLINIKDI